MNDSFSVHDSPVKPTNVAISNTAGAVNKEACKRASLKKKKETPKFWKVVEKG
jgi:hypothetical protein